MTLPRLKFKTKTTGETLSWPVETSKTYQDVAFFDNPKYPPQKNLAKTLMNPPTSVHRTRTWPRPRNCLTFTMTFLAITMNFLAFTTNFLVFTMHFLADTMNFLADTKNEKKLVATFETSRESRSWSRLLNFKPSSSKQMF